MVVVAMIGVLAAVSAPSISSMVANADSQQSLVESAGGVAGARDSARGLGMCIDYVLHDPEPAFEDRYSLDINGVPCPDDPPGAFPSVPIVTRKLLSKNISRITIQPMLSGSLGAPIKTIRFDRNGGLHSPAAELHCSGVYRGQERLFIVYPAAGTVNIVEVEK